MVHRVPTTVLCSQCLYLRCHPAYERNDPRCGHDVKHMVMVGDVKVRRGDEEMRIDDGRLGKRRGEEDG